MIPQNIENKVICIFGPTGVSKTKTAIHLAKNMGEIISADSMQIYKDMDIGTNKTTFDEMKGIPHHLINIVEPHIYYSARHFQNDANQLIREIQHRGNIPFVVGGTGLYFKALMFGLFDGPSRDDTIRSQIEDEINVKGVEYLYNELQTIDPEAAHKIHSNDKKRIIRALEVYRITKKPISHFWKLQSNKETHNFLKIGLTADRKELYQKIEERCDQMIQNGFIEEVKRLKEMGYSLSHQSMQAIGYKHFLKHLEGETNLNETIRLFKRDTRRYAKRQWTLFLSFNNTNWFYPNEIDKMEQLINNFIHNKTNVSHNNMVSTII